MSKRTIVPAHVPAVVVEPVDPLLLLVDELPLLELELDDEGSDDPPPVHEHASVRPRESRKRGFVVA